MLKAILPLFAAIILAFPAPAAQAGGRSHEYAMQIVKEGIALEKFDTFVEGFRKGQEKFVEQVVSKASPELREKLERQLPEVLALKLKVFDEIRPDVHAMYAKIFEKSFTESELELMARVGESEEAKEAYRNSAAFARAPAVLMSLDDMAQAMIMKRFKEKTRSKTFLAESLKILQGSDATF